MSSTRMHEAPPNDALVECASRVHKDWATTSYFYESVHLSNVACVRKWRDGFQLVLDGGRNIQFVDKGVDAFFRHGFVRPRQVTQCFVRVRVGLPAQNALNRLGNDSPVGVQISVNRGLVND